jgi:2-dehydro-3-deoxyphosphogalactonate aldolase
MTPDQVEQVLEAGGTYIISPNVNKTVVRRARELNLISIPGFFTPSEAFAAVDAGADYLKCFPAGVLGAPYLQYLRGVLATPVIAVGGVTADNVQDYLNTAAGVGIGSSVYKPELTSDEIGEIAGRFMKSVGGSR